MKETLGKFTALRMDNGEVIEGNLIYRENSPFAYILTEENLVLCQDLVQVKMRFSSS